MTVAAELKRLKALLAGWEKYSPSPRKGIAMRKIERNIKELEGKLTNGDRVLI